jgi:hypothetical protein
MVGNDALEFIIFQDDEEVYVFATHLIQCIANETFWNYGVELRKFSGQYISDSFHKNGFFKVLAIVNRLVVAACILKLHF